MENIINYIAITITLLIVVAVLNKSLPAGYHRQDVDGDYVPVQTSLWKIILK